MSTERDAIICNEYQNDKPIDVLAVEFKLSHQRIRQILRKYDVWKKQESRPAFLGIDVTEETKEKLKEEAAKSGKSVSRFASDVIERSLERDK